MWWKEGLRVLVVGISSVAVESDLMAKQRIDQKDEGTLGVMLQEV